MDGNGTAGLDMSHKGGVCGLDGGEFYRVIRS